MHALARRTISLWRMVAIALVVCAASTVQVHAQTQDTVATSTVRTVEHEEDNDFPWGLLGLLGLAGLLRRGKKEDVHVHRETVRPVDTHRPASGPVVDRTVIRPDDHHGTGGTGGTTGGGTRL